MLFHVSERPDIERFDPRPSANVEYPVVWAVHAERLHNYLLPRDCPRVTFFARPNSSKSDIARLLAGSRAIVAIEEAWRDRVRTARLFLYRMPEAGFELVDENAGYLISRHSVTPASVDAVDDLPAAIAARGARLVALPSLWHLHDDVAASTLAYSMIRMRNAQPRP